MNRRDDLIQHVFGDLDERRSRQLDAESALRPEIAREAQALRRLREDLRTLRDIPECQLSTDRVRDAVLRSEMKARPRLSLVWLGAPVAVGLVLLALFLLRTDGGQVITQSGIDRGSPLAVAQPLETVAVVGAQSALDFAGLAENVVPTPVAIKPTPAAFSAKAPRRPFRNAVRSESRRQRDEARIVRSPVAAGPVGPVASAKPGSDSSEPTGIVIIDTADPTGETRANEVETASHVVIGG